MNEFPPVLFADIRKSKTVFPLGRPQKWYVVIISEGNYRTLFKSENYTNYSDAVAAARLAMAATTTVFLREPEHGLQLLRRATSVVQQ